MKNTWLVTGALGCIGAWAIRLIRDRGDDVVGFDLGEDRRRVADLLGPDELKQVRWVRGDITSPTDLREAVEGAGAAPPRAAAAAGLGIILVASHHFNIPPLYGALAVLMTFFLALPRRTLPWSK